jgi:hypothetical protein
VREEALIAEVGMVGWEDIDGRKPVCTWLGLGRLVEDDDREEGFLFMGVEVGWGSKVGAVALRAGLEVFEGIVIRRRKKVPNGAGS